MLSKAALSGFVMLLLTCSSEFIICAASEQVHERLVVFSLRNQDILTSFNFTIDALSDDDNSLLYVPWLIRQLFDTYHIHRMRLSMTQGFWRTTLWGDLQPVADSPSGTFLLVQFGEQHNESVDTRWSKLLHELNGVLCASMLEMAPALTSAPSLFPDPFATIVKSASRDGGVWRYGALSSETICSENLKTWKKLLPCKQNGLVSLLEPRNLLTSDFHSLSIDIDRRMNDKHTNWHFELGANTVHFERSRDKQYWSLQNLFAKRLVSKCPIMASSSILVQNTPRWVMENEPHSLVMLGSASYHLYNLSAWDGSEAFGLAANIFLASNTAMKSYAESFSVHSFFTSSNQTSGRLATKIVNPRRVTATIVFSHMIPWQIRVYVHTIRCTCRLISDPKSSINVIPSRREFRLARDSLRPLFIELLVALPAQSTCEISADYEAAFLKITSFPADAHNGVFVPGPIVTILPSSKNSPLMRLHGEPLLILLPVPDFSMPFNVIVIVCSLIAIFYGNVFTMTTKLMKPVFKEEKADGKPQALKKARQKLGYALRNLLNRVLRRTSEKTNED